ncbi:purple acid phosphatase [Puteibacter caeruleilacunae]|nr:purple acid phosphatase [Puteibacter caeruleilacunae]
MKAIYHFLIVLVMGISLPTLSQGGNPKITHGPYLQDLSTNSVVLNWSTSVDCISWVEFYEEDGSNFYKQERERKYNSEAGIMYVGTLHSISLRNLKPNTRYAYRIYSREVTEDGYLGKCTATKVYKKEPLYFTTLNPGKTDVTCVILSDLHEDAEKTGELINGVNWKDTDFALLNGDFANYFERESSIYNVIDTCVDIFAKEKPIYIVRGNHETRGAHAHELNQYFHFPQNKYYYTLLKGTTLFIVLDSGEDKPDSDKEYYGFADYDSYRTEQAEWLQTVIESEEFKNARKRIVVMHIPPFINKSKYEWHGNVEVREKFVPILNKADIDLMICGHTHSYSFIEEKPGRNNFPIIITDNKSRLNLFSDKDALKVRIYNTLSNGKAVESFEF